MQKFIVIMAGGKGERFWPASRENKPKQLLPIISQDSMLKETVKRVLGFIDIDNIIIITRDIYKEVILTEMPELNPDNILCEPEPRDTANAIALASVYIKKKYNDGLVTILPADHYIPDKNNFQKTLLSSFNLIEEFDSLITIGINPDRAETGYGYIEKGQGLNTKEPINGFKVKSFKEKPNYDLATEYFNSREYFWNSGIFVWKNSTFLNEYEKYLPENIEYIDKIEKAVNTKEQEEIIKSYFPKLKKISVDYAVLEKSDKIICVEALFGWDDLGSWSSLYKYNTMDNDGNALKGNGIFIDSSHCLIQNYDNEDSVIGVIGLDNVMVIKHKNGVLVCSKNHDQRVKELLLKIKEDYDGKGFV